MKTAQYTVLFMIFFLLSISVVNASEVNYIHTNHQGSVIEVTDSNGYVIENNRYYPYGEDRGSQGEVSERKYTSQIKDKESDLYYYNARYYDPKLSIFISPDETNDQINRYAYVGSNPIMYTDPTGNECRAGRALCWINDNIVQPIVTTVKQDVNYIVNTDDSISAKAVAGVDLLTLGGFRAANSSFIEYVEWVNNNPDAGIDERFVHAVEPGIAITGLSAELTGYGQLARRGYQSIVNQQDELVTIYHGTSAENTESILERGLYSFSERGTFYDNLSDAAYVASKNPDPVVIEARVPRSWLGRDRTVRETEQELFNKIYSIENPLPDELLPDFEEVFSRSPYSQRLLDGYEKFQARTYVPPEHITRVRRFDQLR